MEEQENFIFDIIKNYDLDRLDVFLKRNGSQCLAATNRDDCQPIEYALRLLMETDKSEQDLRRRLKEIVLLLINAAFDLDSPETVFEPSGDTPLLHLAIATGEGDLIRLLASNGFNPEEEDLYGDYALHLVFNIFDWRQGLRLFSALGNQPDDALDTLIQIVETEDEAGHFEELFPSAHARLCIIAYLAMKGKSKTAAKLLKATHRSLAALLSTVSLPEAARTAILWLAIEADTPDIIAAFDNNIPKLDRYQHPLLKALRQGKEQVAITLVRIGFTTGRAVEMQGFMPAYEVVVSPVLVAFNGGMYGFLETCLREGCIYAHDFVTDLSESEALYGWLKARPELVTHLRMDWKLVNSLITRPQYTQDLIITLWPALSRGFRSVEEDFIFRNRMIGSTRRCELATPLLLQTCVVTEMPVSNYQILIGGFLLENYKHCNGEFLRQICAIGISPKIALTWCSKQVVITLNQHDNTEQRELSPQCIKVCLGAFSGTIEFLNDVAALGPCPYVQRLCLEALGNPDDLMGALATVLELPHLPKNLRAQIEEIQYTLITLWEQVGNVMTPTLKELAFLKFCGTLGLDLCTPDTIERLIKGSTLFSTLSVRMLKIITIIARDRNRLGLWPNPLAAFALVALLEEEDYAWLSNIYFGEAEIEDE